MFGRRQLDVSFNVLRKVEGLEQLACLKKLFLLHNKISSIANLDHFARLEMLELGSNRIRVRPKGLGDSGQNRMSSLVSRCSLAGHREPRRSFVLTEFVPRHQ